MARTILGSIGNSIPNCASYAFASATIISSFRGSIGSLKEGSGGASVARTERDLSVKIVGIGSLVLILLMTVLPQVPGDSILSKLVLGILVVVFGAFFVTVSSQIGRAHV